MPKGKTEKTEEYGPDECYKDATALIKKLHKDGEGFIVLHAGGQLQYQTNETKALGMLSAAVSKNDLYQFIRSGPDLNPITRLLEVLAD